MKSVALMFGNLRWANYLKAIICPTNYILWNTNSGIWKIYICVKSNSITPPDNVQFLNVPVYFPPRGAMKAKGLIEDLIAHQKLFF